MVSAVQLESRRASEHERSELEQQAVQSPATAADVDTLAPPAGRSITTVPTNASEAAMRAAINPTGEQGPGMRISKPRPKPLPRITPPPKPVPPAEYLWRIPLGIPAMMICLTVAVVGTLVVSGLEGVVPGADAGGFYEGAMAPAYAILPKRF